MQQRESGKEYLMGCELVWALDLIKYFGPGLGYMFEKIWMVWLRFALKLSISNLTNFSSAINGYTKTRFDLNFSAAGAYRCESGVGDFDKMEILTCVQICILGFLLSKIFDGPQ